MIPKHLYETYQAVAKTWNVPLESCLEQLAQAGIQRSMQDSIKLDVAGKDGMVELAKKNGLDLTPLTDGLGKMSELVKQLENIQKAFDDGSGTTDKNQ